MDRRWLGWAIMVVLMVVGTLLGVKFPALPPMPDPAAPLGGFAAQSVTGEYTNFSGLVVAAPTTFATATPGTILNSAGTGKILEIQDATTPVASFNDGGAVDLNGNLNIDGTLTLESVVLSGPVTFGTATTVISGTTIAHGIGTTPTVVLLTPQDAGGYTTTVPYVLATDTISITIGVADSVTLETLHWMAGK